MKKVSKQRLQELYSEEMVENFQVNPSDYYFKDGEVASKKHFDTLASQTITNIHRAMISKTLRAAVKKVTGKRLSDGDLRSYILSLNE